MDNSTPVFASKTASNLIAFRSFFGPSNVDNDQNFKGFGEDDPLLITCKKRSRQVKEQLKILNNQLNQPEREHEPHPSSSFSTIETTSTASNQAIVQNNNCIPSSHHHNGNDHIKEEAENGDDDKVKEEKFTGFEHNDPLKLLFLERQKAIDEEKQKLLQEQSNVNRNRINYNNTITNHHHAGPVVCNGNGNDDSGETEISNEITQRLSISSMENGEIIEQRLDESSYAEQGSSEITTQRTDESKTEKTEELVASNVELTQEMEISEDVKEQQQEKINCSESMTQLLDISDQAANMDIEVETTTADSLIPKDGQSDFDSEMSSIKKQMKRLLPNDKGNYIAVKGPRVKQVSHSSGYIKKLPIAKFDDDDDEEEDSDEDSKDDDSLKYAEGRAETAFENFEGEVESDDDEGASEEALFCRQNGQHLDNRYDAAASIKFFNAPLSVEVIEISGFPIISKSPFPPRPSCFLCGSSGIEQLIFCSVCCEPYHPFCTADESLMSSVCRIRTSVKVEKTETSGKEKTVTKVDKESEEKKNAELLMSPVISPLTPVPDHSSSDTDSLLQLKEQFLTWTCTRCLICTTCGQNRRPVTSTSSKSKPLGKNDNEFIKCSHCRGAYHTACLGKQRLEGGLIVDFEPPISVVSTVPTNTTSATTATSTSMLSTAEIDRKNWSCPDCAKCRSCGIPLENNGYQEKRSKKSKVNNLMLCHDCFHQRQKGSFCPLCNVSYDDDDYDTRMMECATCERWIHAKCEGISEEQYQVLSHLPETIEFICKLCDTTKKPLWYQAVTMDIVNGCETILNVFTKKAVTETRKKRRTLTFDNLPPVSENASAVENQVKHKEDSRVFPSNNNNKMHQDSKRVKSLSVLPQTLNDSSICVNNIKSPKSPAVPKKQLFVDCIHDAKIDKNNEKDSLKARILTPTKNNKIIIKPGEKLSEKSPNKTFELNTIPDPTISKLSRRMKRKSDLQVVESTITRSSLRTRRCINFSDKKPKLSRKMISPEMFYELSDGSFVGIRECQVALKDVLKYPPTSEISSAVARSIAKLKSLNTNNTSVVIKKEDDLEDLDQKTDAEENSVNNLLLQSNNSLAVEKIDTLEPELDMILKQDLDDARTKCIELTPKKLSPSTIATTTNININNVINTDEPTPKTCFTPSKKVACFTDLVKSNVNMASILSVMYFRDASLDILQEYYSDVERSRREKLVNQFSESVKEVFTWFDEATIANSDLVQLQKFIKSSASSVVPDDGSKHCELNPFQDVYWEKTVKDERTCSFCSDQGDFPEDGRGRLLWAGMSEWIHLNCALWSSEIWEKEDGQLQNVGQALSRSKTTSCAHCKKKGATLTCCSSYCRNAYHFHCAILAECVLQLDKTIFCPKHPKEQFEEDSIQYEYQVYRKVFVDLDWLKKKERPVFSSDVKVFLGSLKIENLGHIIPLSVINPSSLSTMDSEALCDSKNPSESSSLLISNDYNIKRYFWSTKTPLEKVQYEISASVKKDWFRNFARRKLPTEVNIVVDHSKSDAAIQKKMNHVKSFHDWLDRIPKYEDEFGVEFIPKCPLVFSSGPSSDDEESDNNMDIDTLKPNMFYNSEEEYCDDDGSDNNNTSPRTYNIRSRAASSGTTENFWTSDDIIKNDYEEPFGPSPVDSIMMEEEEEEVKDPSCILNFNFDMDDQASNFDVLDILNSPSSENSAVITTSVNEVADDNNGGLLNEEKRGKRLKSTAKILKKVDNNNGGKEECQINSIGRRKTRSMEFFKYSMLDGALNDTSSSEASFSSSSSSSSAGSGEEDDDEEEEEAETTSESASPTTDDDDDDDDEEISKGKKKKSSSSKAQSSSSSRSQKMLGGQRMTRNRSQQLAESSKRVSRKTVDDSHSGDGPPVRKLRNRENLLKKKKDEKTSSSPEVDCPSCERTFQSQASLKRHSRFCKPQEKPIPAAVKRTSSMSTVDSNASNSSGSGSSASNNTNQGRGKGKSAKSQKLDDDYIVEEDAEEEEEEDESLSSEPVSTTNTRKRAQKKARVIESEDSSESGGSDIGQHSQTSKSQSQINETEKDEQQQLISLKEKVEIVHQNNSEATITSNDNEDKPKTCSKCKLTYRTLASFNKHLPSCNAYSSSDDEERSNDDYSQNINDSQQCSTHNNTSPQNQNECQHMKGSNNSSGNPTTVNNITSYQEEELNVEASLTTLSLCESGENLILTPVPVLDTSLDYQVGNSVASDREEIEEDEESLEKIEMSPLVPIVLEEEEEEQENLDEKTHSNQTFESSLLSNNNDNQYHSTAMVCDQTLKEISMNVSKIGESDNNATAQEPSLLSAPSSYVANSRISEILQPLSSSAFATNNNSYSTSEPIQTYNQQQQQQQEMYNYVTSSAIPQVTQSHPNLPINSSGLHQDVPTPYTIPMQNLMMPSQQPLPPFSPFVPQQQHQQVIGSDNTQMNHNQQMMMATGEKPSNYPTHQQPDQMQALASMTYDNSENYLTMQLNNGYNTMTTPQNMDLNGLKFAQFGQNTGSMESLQFPQQQHLQQQNLQKLEVVNSKNPSLQNMQLQNPSIVLQDQQQQQQTNQFHAVASQDLSNYQFQQLQQQILFQQQQLQGINQQQQHQQYMQNQFQSPPIQQQQQQIFTQFQRENNVRSYSGNMGQQFQTNTSNMNSQMENQNIQIINPNQFNNSNKDTISIGSNNSAIGNINNNLNTSNDDGNVAYIVVQQGNSYSTIPINSSSLNSASAPFQGQALQPSQRGQQQMINLSDQQQQQLQQQISSVHMNNNPMITRNINGNDSSDNCMVINSPCSSLDQLHHHQQKQQQQQPQAPKYFSVCFANDNGLLQSSTTQQQLQQQQSGQCAGNNQLLLPGQPHQNNCIAPNNNEVILTEHNLVSKDSNQILPGKQTLRRQIEMQHQPWQTGNSNLSSKRGVRASTSRTPAATGRVQLLPKILPAINTSPMKAPHQYSPAGNNINSLNITTMDLPSNNNNINNNNNSSTSTVMNVSSETNLYSNSSMNMMSSTSSGKTPISSPNIAVVRPLEHPLQKMSQQISQLGANFNSNSNGNTTLSSATQPVQQVEIIAQQQQQQHDVQENNISGLTSNVCMSQINEGMTSRGHTINDTDTSVINEELQRGTHSGQNHSEASVNSTLKEMHTTGTLTVLDRKGMNRKEVEVRNPTNNNNDDSSSVNEKPSPAVDPIKKGLSDQNIKENIEVGKPVPEGAETKIRLLLRSRKGEDSYSISDISMTGKSNDKREKAWSSLKIKGNIKSGENAGISTNVVVFPSIQTIPIGAEITMDENSEPKIEVIEDKNNNNNDRDTLSVKNASRLPRRAHRAVIIYEVKCNNAILFRSSDVRAVWQHIFETVQGTRLQQNLPPLAYPATNISLPDNKREAASSIDMLGLTHQAVQFLLEQLPGRNSVMQTHKFRFQDPKNEEPPLPVNESGCARTEAFKSRKSFDMLAWLKSKYRNVPANVDTSTSDSATLSDLPVAMQFRNLQQRASRSLVVKSSGIDGRGLFTRRTYMEGEMIIEYAGELIRTILSDKREKFYESKGIGCYFFTINELVICDATMKGNQARFINHSCDPNCRSKVVDILGKKHILIFAIRKILCGEELTYDYKFAIEGNDKKIKCSCGAKKCRKFLN